MRRSLGTLKQQNASILLFWAQLIRYRRSPLRVKEMFQYVMVLALCTAIAVPLHLSLTERAFANSSQARRIAGHYSSEALQSIGAVQFLTQELISNRDESSKSITIKHLEDRNPSAGTKALVEFLTKSGFKVHVDFVAPGELESAAAEEAAIVFTKNKGKKTFLSEQETHLVQKTVERLSLDVKSFFGTYGGVSLIEHFFKPTDTAAANRNELEGMDELVFSKEELDQTTLTVQNILPELQNGGAKLRFTPDLINSLNSLATSILGTAISYVFALKALENKTHLTGAEKALKTRQINVAHVFLMAWVWVCILLQREIGAFKLQGASWKVDPNAKAGTSELKRGDNKAFLFTSSFIQEMIMLWIFIKGTGLDKHMKMRSIASIAAFSAVSYVPIDKIRSVIFLKAEQKKLENKMVEYDKLNRDANILGFVYWNFIFAVFKNVAMFGIKIPEKLLPSFVGHIPSQVNPKLFEYKLKAKAPFDLNILQIPLLGLGITAIGMDLWDERESLKKQGANALHAATNSIDGQIEFVIQ